GANPESVIAVDAHTAAERIRRWLPELSYIRIDAGNLGTITIAITQQSAPQHTPRSEPAASTTPDYPDNRWTPAFALATGDAIPLATTTQDAPPHTPRS